MLAGAIVFQIISGCAIVVLTVLGLWFNSQALKAKLKVIDLREDRDQWKKRYHEQVAEIAQGMMQYHRAIGAEKELSRRLDVASAELADMRANQDDRQDLIDRQYEIIEEQKVSIDRLLDANAGYIRRMRNKAGHLNGLKKRMIEQQNSVSMMYGEVGADIQNASLVYEEEKDNRARRNDATTSTESGELHVCNDGGSEDGEAGTDDSEDSR